MGRDNPMRDLLTVAEVAQEYGVSDETVRRWIRTGAVNYQLVTGQRVRLIKKSEIEKIPEGKIKHEP